ncbi:MAG: chemotaxis protein CheW [Desulfuromonadales bacterium]|jgi:purine-binding chemotaxis protein CheW|nr:chemotaxis protein CheW [Desulfuromonadales bacterium]
MALTLIFTLAEEVYGLEIDAIQEIVEAPLLHYVPRAAGVLTGAINFHGQILAVIDLPTLLDFPGEARDHRQVVLTPQFKSLVLTVSTVQRIAKLDLSALQPPPAGTRSRAIRGVATLDEMMVNLLDTYEVIERLKHQST